MRILFVLLLSGLAGCAYNLTLYPRGGGDIAKGTGDSSRKEITVQIDGETYVGNYIQATSTGFGFVNTYGRSPAFGNSFMGSSSNQFTALLSNGKTALRCEFMAETRGGNGICVDSREKVYDLQISPQ